MTNMILLHYWYVVFAVWPSFYNTLRNFLQPWIFAVSSLISSNLDFVAGAFSYAISTWAVNSSSGNLLSLPGCSSVVSSRCVGYKVSVKMFSFSARYTKSILYFCKLRNILCNRGGVFYSGFTGKPRHVLIRFVWYGCPKKCAQITFLQHFCIFGK